MSIDDFAGTVARVARAGSWSDLADAAHHSVKDVGGAGTSLGVLRHGMVRQSARGFASELSSRYESMPVTAALPGPATVRTRVPQLLTDRATTLARYPAAAPILQAGDLESAACLPLLFEGEAVGYLAAHYRGPHSFDDGELLVLGFVAAAVAGAVVRLRDDPEPNRDSTTAPVADEAWDAVHRTMEHRAAIEQAKGMLMQRFGIDSAAAWNVLRRLSSVKNIKVRDLALTFVGNDALQGVSETFIGEADDASSNASSRTTT